MSLGSNTGLDYATELGIDLKELVKEAFWHPVAAHQNAEIRKRGEEYWEYVRRVNPEPPPRMAVLDAKPRPRFQFTEKQLEIALRSLGGK